MLARYNAEETLVTEEAEADETYAGSRAQGVATRSGELAGAESERAASRSDAAVTLATANRDAASQQHLAHGTTKGARVYFRQLQDGTIEILGKSNKANQSAVIAEVLRLPGG